MSDRYKCIKLLVLVLAMSFNHELRNKHRRGTEMKHLSFNQLVDLV